MENQQTTPVPDQPAAQSQAFSVPEAYAGKPWVEKIKSSDDLWKTLDNAQGLLGRRPNIPGQDASEEDWNRFYTALGRPESPDKYDLKDIDGLPEGADLKPFKAKAAALAHQIGLTPKQAEKLWQGYLAEEMKSTSEIRAKAAEEKKRLDDEFDALAKEHFGDGFDSASKATQDAVSRLVPEKLRGAYADIAENPKALTALVALVNGMNGEMEKLRKEYGAEGKLPGSGDTVGSKSIDEVRKELAALRTSPEARDFLNPKNKETIKRIEQLAGMVQAHYKK